MLTEKQRIEILIMLGCGDKIRSQAEVCTVFNEKYPDNQITQSTVSRVFHKFEEHGTVRDLPRSGRPPALTEDKKIDLMLSLTENPHSSVVTLALDDEASCSTVHRFFKSEKLHPYKPILVQELLEDDYDRRLEFCDVKD